MDWMARMNAAIGYIEENLDGEIDVAEAGRLAGCSAYHFQRVFSYMANTTLAEYIRRRRLTQAAFALQQTNEKVIDIALRYGYDSPTSFTRAFAALHGITPSEAKIPGNILASYPPISFQISIQGAVAMNYRIEKQESFRVVGACLTTTMENDQSLQEIPHFWGKAHAEGLVAKLCALMDTEITGLFGISALAQPDSQTFNYYIAVATSKPTPEGMAEYTVPAATWAIFEATGPMPAAMQTLQKRIYTEWLPGSGYKMDDNAPDIEIYGDGDTTTPDYTSGVWFPIVK